MLRLRALASHVTNSAPPSHADELRSSVAISSAAAVEPVPPAAQSTRVTPAMRQAMYDNGMVIVDDAVEPDMLVRLRAAARHCVAEAHAHPPSTRARGSPSGWYP